MTIHDKLDFIIQNGAGRKIVDLGVGQSFDISPLISDYSSLILANFICEPIDSSTTSYGNYPYDYNNHVQGIAEHKLIKSFNNDTGILTAYSQLYLRAYNQMASGQSTITSDVHAYLVI